MQSNTRPITENEIGPLETPDFRVWTEDGCKTIVKEMNNNIVQKAPLPEKAKALYIYFGRIIAICENSMYGEKIKT